jgi:UDPglucose 6-dehydrogenase
MNVSVIGLGKLGAPMAAVFAAKGHNVVGLDINPAYLAALEAGRAPVEEPRLQEMIDAGKARLRVTADYGRLIAETDITFIIVPTPSDSSGAFSNEYVLAAIEKLGAALRNKSSYHVIVVTSTVMPGATGGSIGPALERASGRKVGSELGLAYNPEFIALGSVVNNMLKPDFLLIGESDERAGKMVAAVYETVCENKPDARRMNFVNAELSKIAVNTFVTTKISYANMLADICDRLPGADVEVVTEAIGSDTRIGRKYLRGAVGYGGPCFPRDNVAFATLAAGVGANADIARATDTINRYQIDRLAAAVTTRIAKGGRVAILGLAYKPDTNVIEESQGILLARRLCDAGYAVTIHDPMAAAAANRVLGSRVSYADSPEEALRDADIGVLVTPWPEYAALATATLPRTVPIVDCWRMLPEKANGSVRPIWIGYGDQPKDVLTRS